MLSKEEMEDIWNNKPIGYLKGQMTMLKKLKNYSCDVMPYKWIYGTKEIFTVKATSMADAEYRALELYRAKYPSSEWEDYKINARLV